MRVINDSLSRCSSLPEFLGIGVQKGGTTTLHRLLAQHPQVALPGRKEVHYFSLHHGRGPGWYGEHFAAARPGQRRGEITPYYVFHPQAAERVASLLPQVRLIVLLRDPVERCLSQYFHSRRLGLEPLDLEAALAAEPGRLRGAALHLAGDHGRHQSHQEHSYQARSRYELQLPAYERQFAPHQLLVLRSEDLFVQPRLVWQQVLQFLELAPLPLPDLSKPANAGFGEAAAVPEQLRHQLLTEFEPTYDWALRRWGLAWDR